MESNAESNDNLDINEQKTINITGQNNKYQMKKLIKERNTEPKKREVSKKWSFDEVYFNYDKQIKIINDISKMDLENNIDDDITKIAVQEINKKICIYKHQDIIKKKLDLESFIDFNCIIDKMIE
jgi:hypothetical protein